MTFDPRYDYDPCLLWPCSAKYIVQSLQRNQISIWIICILILHSSNFTVPLETYAEFQKMLKFKRLHNFLHPSMQQTLHKASARKKSAL